MAMEKKGRAFGFILPACLRLRPYDRALVRRDALAGLTVASVALPQAMAYALLAGVSPVCGIYTAIVVTALGSLFGSSTHLINGPTNAISLVVFGVVSGVGTGPDDPGRIGLAALLAVLAGLIQICLSVVKLGGLARHIPEAVLLGFMAGAGLLEALTQIPAVVGLPLAGAAADHLLYRLWLTGSRGGPVDGASLVISLGTVALVGGLHWLNRRLPVRIPELPLSVVLISLFVGALDVAPPEGRLSRLHVARAFPTPQLPMLAPGWAQQLGPIAGGALTIALLGLVETLTMARTLAVRSGQPLDYDRQCLAEGLANLGGGLCGCLPGAGSLSRSAMNYDAGAATRWSGVFSAAAVAAALALFGPLAGFVPQPALAGVLLWTAWLIIGPGRLWDCLRSSRVTAAVTLFTAFIAVFVGIPFAIPAGIASSLLCRGLRRWTPVGRQPACDSGANSYPAVTSLREVVAYARTDRTTAADPSYHRFRR